MAKKSQRAVTWLIAAAIVLALLAGIGIGLLIPQLQNTGLFRDRAVMRCRETDYTLSQTEFSYYYWSEFYYFRDVYGDYLSDMFDPEKPLSEQKYSETQTWQDYMTERALTTAQETAAMVFRAAEEGYVMSAEAEQSLAKIEQNFRDAAKAQGFGSFDGYLRDSFGNRAGEKSFLQYLRDAHLASDYAAHLKAQIEPDEDTVRAYLSLHQDAYAAEDDPFAAAKADYIDEEYRNVYLSVIGGYSFEVDYNNTAAAISAAANKEADTSAESVKK